MAFFNTNVQNMLVDDLDHAYEDMAYGGSYAVLIGLFEKADRQGAAVDVPVKRDNGGGQSGTAATAYANATLAGREKFIVPPFKCYGMSVVPLDQDAWTKGDNAVAGLLLDESKAAMDNAKMQLDAALGSDGFGTLGTISANTNTSGSTWVLTLSLSSDVNHFSPDQILVSKATPSTGSLDTGQFQVTKVDAASKKITGTALNSFAPTNTHVLGLQGTMAASTSISTWAGIPAWIPAASNRPLTSGASGLLYSVERTNNERKLAGSYLDGTKMGILEGINQLAYSTADVPGAKPDCCVMSFPTLGRIQAQLQSERRYTVAKVKGSGIDVFYDLIVINGPKGPMALVGSSNWPANLVGVLDTSSWYCASPGNKPFVPATSTGNPVVEIPGADSVVCQYRAQAAIYCNAPGHNGMLTINAS